jgi:HSP20 family molecular chaperone IbpA
MKSMKTSLLLAAFVATLTSVAQARGSCRGLYSPHRRCYDYHRRHHPNAFDLVSDMFSVPFYSTNSLFRQQQDQLARGKQNITPRYSLSHSEDGKLVELAMEVPGVTAKDLSVEVENGSMLRIKGSRTIHKSGSSTKAEFDQSFQLDQDIDVENISVSLSSGILTVTAPKKEATVKRIQLKIVESDPTEERSKSELVVEKEGRDDSGADAFNIRDDNEEEDFVITEDE